MMSIIERSSVVVPADGVPGPQQGQWTYKDYVAVPEDGYCYEVVNGVLYMAPSPSAEHQGAVLRIAHYLLTYIEFAGLGKVFMAPFDVELDYQNIVQPDVLVILHEHLDRVTKSRIIGAPDLVVEVASPGTVRHDLTEKQDAYAHAGVPEYWIVNPDAQTVEVLVLSGSAYRSLGLFSGSAILKSRVITDLPVKVKQFFAGI